MDFAELMDKRWSCRAFHPDPVDRDTLRQIFATAQRTGSWCNTQPWAVHLFSGDATRRLAAELTAHAAAHPSLVDHTPDVPLPERYVGRYQQRRRAAGHALYASLGIDRDDRAAREAVMQDNYSFFGAPHVAIITSDRAQGVYAALDCGAYVANLTNAALDLGVATIAQGAIGVYAGKVRELLALPDDRVVGYPDNDHPANRFRTERADLSDLLTELN
jgi:nitroreductase